MGRSAKKPRINKTYRLRIDVVRRIERRAQERGLSPTATLEDLVDTAIPERDPVTEIEALAKEAHQARRGKPVPKWRGFTKDELHEDDA